jgi:hypothetical protein
VGCQAVIGLSEGWNNQSRDESFVVDTLAGDVYGGKARPTPTRA